MSPVDLVKKLLRWMASTAARVILARLAPGQPRLTKDEWVGCHFSFAQLGEDRFLVHLLQGLRERTKWVYVDVGAHDPILYSNTLLLHKAGWSGINIDASEQSIHRFRAHRPGDRNVWAAVSDVCRQVVYYRYPNAPCNRILAPEDLDAVSILGEKPVGSTRMTTRSINDLLAEYTRPAERIGFLNIDCEGEDLKILQALDWVRWRPYLVAVESHTRDTTAEMCRHLTEHGYVLVGQFLMTLVFCDPTLPEEQGGSTHPIARHSVAAGPGDLYQPRRDDGEHPYRNQLNGLRVAQISREEATSKEAANEKEKGASKSPCLDRSATLESSKETPCKG